MAGWVVVVEFDADGAKPLVSPLPRVRRLLDSSDVRVYVRTAFDGRRFVVCSFGVKNDSAMPASAKLAAFLRGCRYKLGMTEEPVSSRLHPADLPEQLPELVGLSEIADQHNLSRQRIQQLTKQDHRFPLPLTRVGGRLLYAKSSVDQYFGVYKPAEGSDWIPKTHAIPTEDWHPGAEPPPLTVGYTATFGQAGAETVFID
jgi:hypothetical protein